MEENPDVSEMLNKMKQVLLTNEETNKNLENSKRELKESKDRCNEVVKEVYLSAAKILEEAFEETKNQVQHDHDNLRERQEDKQKILQRCNLALGLEIVELAGSKCEEISVRKYEEVLDSCREALNMRNVNHNVVFNFIPNPKLKPKLGVLQLCDNLPSDFKLVLLTHTNSIAVGKQVSCAIQGELTKENLQHLEFCIRLETNNIAAEMTKVEDKMVTFSFRPDSGGVYSVMVQLFGLNIVASPLTVVVPLNNDDDYPSNSTPQSTNVESKTIATSHDANQDNSTQRLTKETETKLKNVKKSTDEESKIIHTPQIDEDKNIENKVTLADVPVSVAEDKVGDPEESEHEELLVLDGNHHNRFDQAGDDSSHNRFDEAGDVLADDSHCNRFDEAGDVLANDSSHNRFDEAGYVLANDSHCNRFDEAGDVLANDCSHNRFDEAGDRLADDTTWKVGDRCIARWEEDEVWYRAEVKKLQKDGVLVSFIDYGNSAVVSRLVNMFIEIPHTDAYDSNVIEIPHTDAYDNNVIEIPHTDACDNVVEIPHTDAYDSNVVEIPHTDAFDNNVIPTESPDENQNSMKDTTMNTEKESVAAEHLPKNAISTAAEDQVIAVEADVHAIPIEANDQPVQIEMDDQAIPIEADDQTIQLEADDQAIPIEAKDEATQLTERKVSVGDVCIARWEEDQVWYNCVVENILGNGSYYVNFVDYGNSEVVCEPFIVNTGVDIPKEVPKEQIDSNVTKDTKNEGPEELVKLTNDNLFIPSVGEMCVARWESDKIWYNARVEGQNEDGSFWVNFNDYGNTEIVCLPFIVKSASNIPEDVVKESIDEHVVVNRNQSKSQTPEHAFQKLSAETGGGKKLEDATTCESSLFSVGDVCLARWVEDGVFYNAIVTSVLEDGSYNVMFADYGNTATVDAGNLVRNAKELPTEITNDYVDENVKFVESSIKNKEGCLEEESVPKFSVGQACVARWAQDLVWYNGKIVHDNKDGSYLVEFVDYGNTEAVKSIYILEDASKIPIDTDYVDENVDQRMRGTKIVIKHDSTKDATSIELQSSSIIKDYTQDVGKDEVENTIAKVKSNNADVLKYEQEDENAKRLTKKRKKSTPAVPRPLKEAPSGFEQTANDVSQTKTEVLHAWQPGDNCLALWSEDSVWYRAVVKRRNINGTYTVTFTDYGNEEDVQPGGLVLDHLALVVTGRQCVVDVHVKVDKANIVSHDDAEGNRTFNSNSSFGFNSSPVSPSQNPETDGNPLSLPVEVRNMNASLNLLELMMDLPRGGHVLPTKEVLHISDVKGPIGISVLRNKNILITSSWDNSVNMFSPRGEIIAPVQSRRPFKRPSDIFTLSTGDFVVRDDIGLQLFTEEGSFIKVIGQGQIDKCYGVTEDDEGHIVTVNAVRASESAKPGAKGKGGLTVVGETDIFYIDRECGKVVKQIEMIDIIQDRSKSKCRFVNFHKENVYIVDLGLDRIYVLNTNGNHADFFGSHGKGKGQFEDPAGLVVDDFGNIIVADSRNHRLQIFDSDNDYVGDVLVGKPLNRPSGIYLDKQCKELYVLNYWGNSMTKYRIG